MASSFGMRIGRQQLNTVFASVSARLRGVAVSVSCPCARSLRRCSRRIGLDDIREFWTDGFADLDARHAELFHLPPETARGCHQRRNVPMPGSRNRITFTPNREASTGQRGGAGRRCEARRSRASCCRGRVEPRYSARCYLTKCLVTAYWLGLRVSCQTLVLGSTGGTKRLCTW
jgi:hypothetical protein